MPAYPGTLPTLAIARKARGAGADNKVRSQMSGAVKQRKRFTAAWRPQTMGHPSFTRAQLVALLAFHDDTLEAGALSFTMTDPVTSATQTFRFVSPPGWRGHGAGYDVTCELEVLV